MAEQPHDEALRRLRECLARCERELRTLERLMDLTESLTELAIEALLRGGGEHA